VPDDKQGTGSLYSSMYKPEILSVCLGVLVIGQEELVSCSSDYPTRWLAIKLTFNNV
jgi:hypothetical protein